MHKNISKTLSIITICGLLSTTLSGCGGRTASPVMVSQYGDPRKSCKVLEHEIINTQHEIQSLLPKRDKTGKNVALGVAGWFLIVPWFFMDFKNAEATEYEAYRQRYQHLTAIAMDKNCDVATQNYPSISEMQREYEKKKENDAKQRKTTND